MSSSKASQDLAAEPMVALTLPMDYLSGASEEMLDRWVLGLQTILSNRYSENIHVAIHDNILCELELRDTWPGRKLDATGREGSITLMRRHVSVMVMPNDTQLPAVKVETFRQRAKQIGDELTKDNRFVQEAWKLFTSMLPPTKRLFVSSERRD